jgi:hypothetical protein
MTPATTKTLQTNGALHIATTGATAAFLSLGLPFVIEYKDISPSRDEGRSGDPFTWPGWGLYRDSRLDGYEPLPWPVAVLVVLATAGLAVLACAALSHGRGRPVNALALVSTSLLVGSLPLGAILTNRSHHDWQYELVTGPGVGVWRLALLVTAAAAMQAALVADERQSVLHYR